MYGENYLAHYGIPGLRWGVRKYRDASGNYTASGKARYVKDKVAAIQRDIDSFKGIKNGVKTKTGKQVLTRKDVDDAVSGLESSKRRREAKFSRKYDIAKARQDIDRQTGTLKKLVYNSRTRDLAARYVVDRNMTISDATKKAEGAAWRNSVAFVGLYGAAALISLKAFR